MRAVRKRLTAGRAPERKPWYDRRASVTMPCYLALWTAWFAFWLRPRGALGGAFVLAMFVLMGVDIWRSMPRFRRQPRWVQELAVGAFVLGLVVAAVVL